MIRYIVLLFVCFFLGSLQVIAAPDIQNINVRDISVGSTNVTNNALEGFVSPFREFFFTAPIKGGEGLYTAFVAIAFQIKNFFILIAIIFLIFGVLKLLFSQAGEEDVAKWRNNIIWVSVGVFLMQISFSIWNTLLLKSSLDTVGSTFGYQMWINVFLPVVKLLQMLAALGFIIMMLYAFYIIVSGGGDEEKLKKGKNTVIYALVGFFLIKIPEALVSALYGSPDCKTQGWLTLGDCSIKKQNLSGGVEIIAKVFNYFNTFLTILCIILVIYAGWLVIISGGDEEKLKKAKNIILYIILGFIILVGSHAIFRFFILRG